MVGVEELECSPGQSPELNPTEILTHHHILELSNAFVPERTQIPTATLQNPAASLPRIVDLIITAKED